MCGITGVVSVGGFRPDVAYVTALRDAMAHRGPDNGTNWFAPDGRVAMAHRRLAIVDLAPSANQPFISIDKKQTLVFNGEIYNHAALRAQLVAEGVDGWQTSHSDTEVIMQAYRAWGLAKTLAHLRGMFAFALWDEEAQALYCARDRAGEKPFYYTLREDGVFVFGSEIKAILADETVPRVVDEEALFHYLSFLMVPPPRTLFAGIKKLPAAHWLEFRMDGTLATHRYWDPLDAAEARVKEGGLPADDDEAEWVSHLQKLVRESVVMRQESADVPVGVFLSGGIDSSTIAALVARNFVDRGGQASSLSTFAIGPDGAYPSWPDETPFAKLVAESIGSTHATARLSEAQALAFLPTFIHVQDEPVADPSSMPLAFIAKAASDAGLKVVQGGEGGDELFIGYEDWLKFDKLTRWNAYPVPAFLKSLLYKILMMAGLGHKFYAEYLRRGSLGQPLFWGGAEAFTNWEKHRLLGERVRGRFVGRTSYEIVAPVWRAFKGKKPRWRAFWNWCTYVELHLRLPEQLLMRADKMTMATALEMRVPLLDHELIASVLASPAALRAPGGDKKHLLKQMVKGLLPDVILTRKKQGLGMPLDEWILTTYGTFAHGVLKDFCALTGLLDWPAVERLFAQKRGQHVWYLLNLALWHRHFIERKEVTVPR